MSAMRWEVLGLENDPVPGDPEQIRRSARAVSRMSGVATSAHDDLGAVVTQLSGDAWVGETGERFREAVGQRFRPALELVGESLHGAGTALLSWANDVEDAQRQANHLLAQGVAASDELSSASTVVEQFANEVDRAQREFDAAPPGSPEALAAAQRLSDAQAQLSSRSASVVAAQRRLDGAIEAIQTVVDDYSKSAAQTAAALNRSANDTRAAPAAPKPGFWQTAGNATLDAASEVGNTVVSLGNAIVEHPDEGAWLLAGLAAMQLGGGIAAGGGALDITVVGATIGVPANVVGGAVAAAGLTAVGVSSTLIARHAGTDSATSPFDTDRVMRSEAGATNEAGHSELGLDRKDAARSERLNKHGRPKGPPQSSPKFREPTNPEQDPPAVEDLPKVPGVELRIMRPTADYLNGYWVIEKPNGTGWQQYDPSTNGWGRRKWETHVPLPSTYWKEH